MAQIKDLLRDSGILAAVRADGRAVDQLRPVKITRGWTQAPEGSVLIECGFISNSAEEKLLLDSAYQARLGEAIAQGVMDYLSLEARRSATPG